MDDNPSPKTHPVNFKILLRQINAVRAAANMALIEEIPQGNVQSSERCPIARALSNGIKARVDSDEICLMFPKMLTPEKAKEICQALRRAGFSMVEFDYDYTPRHITFKPSNTMSNFINRFDVGQLTDYIKGRK